MEKPEVLLHKSVKGFLNLFEVCESLSDEEIIQLRDYLFALWVFRDYMNWRKIQK